MNQRFLLATFAGCTIVFAGVWAATTPAPQPIATPDAATPPAVMYADCDAVRAANAAPLRASQPGYRPALDPNMNGIACETVGVPDTGASSDAAPPMDSGAVPDLPTPPPLPPEQANPTPEGVPEQLPVLT